MVPTVDGSHPGNARLDGAGRMKRVDRIGTRGDIREHVIGRTGRTLCGVTLRPEMTREASGDSLRCRVCQTLTTAKKRSP